MLSITQNRWCGWGSNPDLKWHLASTGSYQEWEGREMLFCDPPTCPPHGPERSAFILNKLKKQERDLKVPVMVKCSRTCRIEGDMGEVFGRKQYLVMRSRVGHR